LLVSVAALAAGACSDGGSEDAAARTSSALTTTGAASAPGNAELAVGANPCTGNELPSYAAFDVVTGELRWSLCSVEREFRRVIAITPEIVFAQELDQTAGAPSFLTALDVTNGAELWRTQLDEVVEWPKGEFAGGGVVVLTRGAPTAAEVVGLDAGTGAELWSVDAAGEPPPPTTAPLVVNGTTIIVAPRPYPELSRPVAGTEEIVVVMADLGRLAGLDRSSGAEVWAGPSRVLDGLGDGGGHAAAAVLGDTVVLRARPATIAIDARTGADLWQGDPVDDLWAAEGTVIGTKRTTVLIAALDGAGGETRWEAPGQPSYDDVMALGAGGVYVYDLADGSLVAYDLATGATRWRQPAPTTASFLGLPEVVTGDVLLVGSDGLLAGISTQDGSLRWGWHQPLGSDWMSTVRANESTAVVAVNSVSFTD
jgi:outer membrane protein assembly factor BamB